MTESGPGPRQKTCSSLALGPVQFGARESSFERDTAYAQVNQLRADPVCVS